MSHNNLSIVGLVKSFNPNIEVDDIVCGYTKVPFNTSAGANGSLNSNSSHEMVSLTELHT